MENECKKQPQKIFGCGSVQAAIWFFQKEKDGEIVEVPSVKINRSYKDKETGEWVNTPFLRMDDLLNAALVATEAYKDLRMRTFEPKNSQNDDNNNSPYEQTDDNPES